MSRAWRGGSTTAWRRLRAVVLANNQATNQGRCTLAVPGVCVGEATQVHHTLGRSVTGDDPRFLAAACGPCNRHVGDPRKHNPQPKLLSRW